jgi:predicted lipoprotein
MKAAVLAVSLLGCAVQVSAQPLTRCVLNAAAKCIREQYEDPAAAARRGSEPIASYCQRVAEEECGED